MVQPPHRARGPAEFPIRPSLRAFEPPGRSDDARLRCSRNHRPPMPLVRGGETTRHTSGGAMPRAWKEREDLDKADQDIAEAEERVAAQTVLIEWMTERGHDT